MRMPRLRFIVALAVCAAVGVAYFAWSRGSDARDIATASAWARLAALPAGARDVRVEATGGMFTRGVVITFTAPPAEVDQWLRASPGPASAKRSVERGTTVYGITPGDRAAFAEVRVNEATGAVTIRTYWS